MYVVDLYMRRLAFSVLDDQSGIHSSSCPNRGDGQKIYINYFIILGIGHFWELLPTPFWSRQRQDFYFCHVIMFYCFLKNKIVPYDLFLF